MKFIVGENKRPYTIEPGVVQATLTHINDVGELGGRYNKRKIAITFELDRQYKTANGELRNMTINGLYTPTMNELSNLFKLVSGLLGRKLITGETFNSEDLIGKRCMLAIEIGDNNYPQIANVLPPMDALPAMTVQNIPPDEWILKRCPSAAQSQTALES